MCQQHVVGLAERPADRPWPSTITDVGDFSDVSSSKVRCTRSCCMAGSFLIAEGVSTSSSTIYLLSCDASETGQMKEAREKLLSSPNSVQDFKDPTETIKLRDVCVELTGCWRWRRTTCHAFASCPSSDASRVDLLGMV